MVFKPYDNVVANYENDETDKIFDDTTYCNWNCVVIDFWC